MSSFSQPEWSIHNDGLNYLVSGVFLSLPSSFSEFNFSLFFVLKCSQACFFFPSTSFSKTGKGQGIFISVVPANSVTINENREAYLKKTLWLSFGLHGKSISKIYESGCEEMISLFFFFGTFDFILPQRWKDITWLVDLHSIFTPLDGSHE